MGQQDVALANPAGVRFLRADDHFSGVLEMLLRDPLDFWRHRCREQHHLTLAGELFKHPLHVIDEACDKSKGGDESSASAGLSCPVISLLPGADGPGDLPHWPADVCDLSNSMLDYHPVLFQDTEYAEVPLDEAVPFTTLVKVEALDLLGGQLGPDPEVCFLTLYSALTELAVVVYEQQRDPLLCGCPGHP